MFTYKVFLMAFNLTRMTAYALLSAIEEDFRDLVKDYVVEESKLAPELAVKARQRIDKDIGGLFEDITFGELVDYFDLGDTFQVINSNRQSFPENIYSPIKQFNKQIEGLIPIRNRVMHIRPLNYDDLPTIMNFCEQLVEYNLSAKWQNISATLSKIEENPSFVLSLDITKYDDDNVINHNLPMPDFDETGLIGRDKEIEQIKKLCYGSFPVISILGEGGVGKSALALKVAYELIENDKYFDAVIWVTSKTTQITLNEIREIKGAISSSLGIIEEAGSQIMNDHFSGHTFDEVIEYLATFRVALFLDNLETIMDDNIRNFVGSLPQGSKIIITSRIGLGAYEYPIKLQGIEERYASQLLRMVARIRGVDSISKLADDQLRKYVNRMHRNPSYIKWFVSSVQTGISIESVLQNSGSFLDFCMSNVYEYLSENAQQITTSMQCIGGFKDLPELAYLNDFSALQVQDAVQELMATDMLRQRSDAKDSSVKTMYQLSELARAYLDKHHKPSSAFQKKIMDKRNKLNSAYEQQMNQQTSDKYNPINIQFREKSDRVVVRELQEIQKLINRGIFDEAFERLEEVHGLAPEYFEVARFKAYFYQKIGNISDARGQYELAIILAPNKPQLYYWFGKFLFHSEDNVDGAAEQFEKAHKIEPSSAKVSVALARAYLVQHEYAKSQKIIDSLKDTILQADDFSKKFYYDVSIQIKYRSADDFSRADNYIESLKSLEDMIVIFNLTPIKYQDSHIKDKLKKCSYITNRLAKDLKDGELIRLRKVIECIDKITA